MRLQPQFAASRLTHPRGEIDLSIPLITELCPLISISIENLEASMREASFSSA
jgi:hypothetical protein